MAIDPRMYEKYSGRSGDPYKRLGEALSQGAQQQQRRDAASDMSYYERSAIGHAKMKVVGVVIFGIIAVLAIAWRLLFR